MDVLKSVGSKVFRKTIKEVAKKAATKAAETAASKTGEFAGNKAGGKKREKTFVNPQPVPTKQQPFSDYEIAESQPNDFR